MMVMARKKAHAPEEIVAKLRQAEVLVGQVEKQLRSRHGCNGPLKFRLDHSMGAGHMHPARRLDHPAAFVERVEPGAASQRW